MIDKSSLLKSQGSLYLEFISKDGLFHKMLLLSLMGFLTGWCNHYLAPPTHFLSCDIINVIFGKTAITPSFAQLKTSRKNLNYLGQPNIGSAKY